MQPIGFDFTLMAEDKILRAAAKDAWGDRAQLTAPGTWPTRIEAPGATHGDVLRILAPFALCLARPRPAALVFNVAVNDDGGDLLAGWLMARGRAEGFIAGDVHEVVERVGHFLAPSSRSRSGGARKAKVTRARAA